MVDPSWGKVVLVIRAGRCANVMVASSSKTMSLKSMMLYRLELSLSREGLWSSCAVFWCIVLSFVSVTRVRDQVTCVCEVRSRGDLFGLSVSTSRVMTR